MFLATIIVFLQEETNSLLQEKNKSCIEKRMFCHYCKKTFSWHRNSFLCELGFSTSPASGEQLLNTTLISCQLAKSYYFPMEHPLRAASAVQRRTGNLPSTLIIAGQVLVFANIIVPDVGLPAWARHARGLRWRNGPTERASANNSYRRKQ